MQKRVATFLALLICTLGIVCCGGGGGGSTIGPTPDFVLLVQPVTIAAAPGTSITAQIQVQSENGFAGQVSVTISGLPSGVTVSPAGAITVPPGQTQTVTLNVASSAQLASSTVTFQGTSGSLSHSSPATLDIEGESSIALSIMPIDATLYIGSTLALNIMPEVSTAGASNFTLTYAAPNLPAGVTAAFQPASGSPSTPVTLTLTSSSKTQQSFSTTINVVATRSTDSAQFDGNTAIYIYPLPGTLPGNRTATVRTDESPASGVFDPAHGNYFVALTGLNRVSVISAATQKITKQIQVPSPTSVAITPDGTRILVGTLGQNLFWIDTSSLSVVRQDTMPLIVANGTPPEYFSTIIALPVANGSVLIFGLQNSTWGTAVEWNPSTNATKVRTEIGVSFDPASPMYFAAAANGSGVMFDYGSYALLYVASTDNFLTTSINGIMQPAANPTGTQYALVGGTTVFFYDANLNMLGQTQLNINQRPTSGVYSADGKYLYVVTPGVLPLISVIDTSTFALIGAAPAYVSFYPSVGGDNVETPFAADATGLIFGWIDRGVVFDDARNIQPLSASGPYGAPDGVLFNTPDEGSSTVATPTTIFTQDFALLPDVWFGPLRSSGTSFNSVEQVQATAPPSTSPGSVDVKVIEPTGEQAVIPQGFTYGTVVVPYATLAAPPLGGQAADLFGYGFGADAPNKYVDVSVGGSTGGLDSVLLLQSEILSGFPTPMQHVVFNVPAGQPGVHDITITTASGQATIPHGFRYITGVADFNTPDSLQAVVFDKSRNKLFLSAGDHIDVFSLASNSFGTPIPVPSSGPKKLLAGLALTPDASRLVVADAADNSLAVINPDNPTAASVIPLTTGPSVPLSPNRVATTSLGTAFVGVTSANNATGSQSGVYQVNLSTKQVSVAIGPDFGTADLAGSYDGTVVFDAYPGNSGGSLFSWTAASGTWTIQGLQQYLADAAVSGDGNALATLPYDPNSGVGLPPFVLDNQNNVRCQTGVLDVAFFGLGSGIRLDDTGALVFAPSANGYDIFDSHHCDLRERLYINEQVNTQAVTPTAVDSIGQRIFLITTAGLTVVTLDAAPLSIGHLVPANGAAGSSITVRGTGFVQGTSATFNGTSSAVTFVDGSTIQITIPTSLPAGAVSLALSNPDGTTYTLDNAFTIQ